jgi:hypothetical protein
MARIGLEPQILADRPANATLKKYWDFRKVEVRELAMRSSCYLGDFEAVVRALGEKDVKPNSRKSCVEELRAAVARSPESASTVLATLERERAADAGLIYRMLWSYSAEDLKNGADQELVEALSHPSLDVRELAIWNLQAITGASLGYKADDTAAKRKQSTNSWRDRLRKNSILPKPSAT